MINDESTGIDISIKLISVIKQGELNEHRQPLLQPTDSIPTDYNSHQKAYYNERTTHLLPAAVVHTEWAKSLHPGSNFKLLIIDKK